MFGISGLLRTGSRRAEVKSIRQVLTGPRIFLSPASPHHQPGVFHWSAPEVAQFLIELEENSGERPSHADEECFYLGVLSLSPDAREYRYRILDGLQRLTAISMFLAFARDRLPSRGERNRINKLLYHSPLSGSRTARLQLGGPEQDWFNLFILDAGATRELPAFADGDSQRNLLACAKFMHRVFRNYKTSQIRNLVRCLERRTAFVISEAVQHAVPDRFALPAPPVEERPAEPAAAGLVAFDPLPEARVRQQPFAAAPPARPSAPIPQARRNALWTNTRPFAVDTPPPRPANEDRPRIAVE